MTGAVHRSTLRRRRGELREEILAAASDALRDAPYRELSIEGLMASAGLSRTLFYRHFDDLADVVVRLLDEAAAELYEHERRLVETGASGPAAIRMALAQPVRTFERNGPLLRAVAEAASHDERIELGWRALVDRFTALIEGYLAELDSPAVSDPRETARALNLLNTSYLLDVFGGPEPKVSAETALRTLSEIWTGAILGPQPTPEGR